jgi:hypothetical protein
MMTKPCKTPQKESTQERECKRNKGARSKQANCPKEAGTLGGKGTNKQIINTNRLKLREKDAYFLLTK